MCGRIGYATHFIEFLTIFYDGPALRITHELNKLKKCKYLES